MFNVGDKVICINDKLDRPEKIIEGALRVGSIYTISDIYPSSVEVKEIKTEIKYLTKYTFHVWRFRKLWDDKMLKEYQKDKIKELEEV